MAAETVVRVRAELDNAVMVRPGDTLVIGVTDADPSQFDENTVAQIRAALPDVKVVVIDGVSAFAVYRPHEQREPEGM